jgi:hypothetical protein
VRVDHEAPFVEAGGTARVYGSATVARRLRRASHRSLAGEWHGVPDDGAPVLMESFRE